MDSRDLLAVVVVPAVGIWEGGDVDCTDLAISRSVHHVTGRRSDTSYVPCLFLMAAWSMSFCQLRAFAPPPRCRRSRGERRVRHASSSLCVDLLSEPSAGDSHGLPGSSFWTSWDWPKRPWAPRSLSSAPWSSFLPATIRTRSINEGIGQLHAERVFALTGPGLEEERGARMRDSAHHLSESQPTLGELEV